MQATNTYMTLTLLENVEAVSTDEYNVMDTNKSSSRYASRISFAKLSQAPAEVSISPN